MKAELNPRKKIMVLDGTRTGGEDMSSVARVLTEVCRENGAEVRVFSTNDLKIAHCIGCFACWLETPGICRYKEPTYQELFKTWVQSDTVIMLTPVIFGGYSTTLKKFIDRTLPVLLPYFQNYLGEIHHMPRYAKRPRIIGIGLQDIINNTEAETFKKLVGRHAIDMIAPSYAAEVININDSRDKMLKVFQSLFTRKDVFPRGNTIKNMVPPGEAAASHPQPGSAQRACLVIGSPKTLSNSTSGILGKYILDILKQRGWETESFTLKQNLSGKEGETALYEVVDRADLLIFAFPLYIDAPPYLVARAMELIAGYRRKSVQPRPVRMLALSNNGFPESYQNNVSFTICRNFASAAGITWAGGLALGAGEATVSGEPLKEFSQQGFPIFKLHQALTTTAEALAQGQPVPNEAIQNLASCPIPLVPYFAWRIMFTLGAKKFWQVQAAGHGVSKANILARPFGAGTKS
jgi:multimeric flavodoxin WrbA